MGKKFFERVLVSGEEKHLNDLAVGESSSPSKLPSFPRIMAMAAFDEILTEF